MNFQTDIGILDNHYRLKRRYQESTILHKKHLPLLYNGISHFQKRRLKLLKWTELASLESIALLINISICLDCFEFFMFEI